MAVSWIAQIFQRFVVSAKSCANNSRGNVAIVFALSIVPLVICAGIAIDFARVADAKAEIDALADAAVLLSINQTMATSSLATAQSAGLKEFQATQAPLTWITIQSANLTVTNTLTTRNAVFTYTATIPASFSGLLGQSTLTFTGTSTAQGAAPTYTDVYILVDNSSSMGIAATTSDIINLQNLTPDQCAFACHETDKPNSDYYSIARKNGITLRIDSVRNAVLQVINLAKQTQANSPNQFRFAIYTLGSSTQNMGLTPVYSLSSDPTGATTPANSIDLMSTPYQNYNSDEGTDLTGTLMSLDAAIPSQGTGATQSSTKKLVFFISDGLNDHAASTCGGVSSGSRCEEPVTASSCADMKSRGLLVSTIYTTYLPIPANSWYVATVDPYNAGPFSPSPNSQIEMGMLNCASSGYFQEVGPNDNLSSVISNIFLKAILVPRITG